jgi:hypothetical protein
MITANYIIATKPKTTILHPMIDVRDPSVVEIDIDQANKKVWVNVDGQCVLRIQAIGASCTTTVHPKDAGGELFTIEKKRRKTKRKTK